MNIKLNNYLFQFDSPDRYIFLCTPQHPEILQEHKLAPFSMFIGACLNCLQRKWPHCLNPNCSEGGNRTTSRNDAKLGP